MPMKKIRNWRSMRLTRSKTRKQEEARLERAMNSKSSETFKRPDHSVLWVFINDFTDSDNHAAALIWAKFLVKHPDLKGIYIAEPRHVDLGYYTTSEEFKECISLVGRLRPRLDSGDEPIKTVLAGNLTEDDINKSKIADPNGNEDRYLEEGERKLLQRLIKPHKNPTELEDARKDAIRHAELLVMDFLSTMKTGAKPTFDTYIDHCCLEKGLQRPINLKTHYHEELVFRTAKELKDFKAITERGISLPDKAKELRKWYDVSIERKLKDFDNHKPWRELTGYDGLFDEMRDYRRVIVFGGCSLTILKELLEKDDADLSKRVEYYQQGGTFTPELNILGNPLNFALHLDAAKTVFENADKLAKFRLIPTDTTKKIEFTLQGLTRWSPAIGLHSLGFYGKVDIWDLITPEEEQCPSASTQDIIRWRSRLVFDSPKYNTPSFRAHKVVMADLTAYLISFTDAFKKYTAIQGDVTSSESGVKSITDGDKMKLEEDKGSSIKALMLKLPSVERVIVVDDTPDLINSTIETGSSSFRTTSRVGTKDTCGSAEQ